MVSNAYGSGTEFSSAGIGDEEYAKFTAIPFANGNPDVSNQRIQGRVVVPDLHAEAKGSATSPSAGVAATSQGAADFSDVLSISQFQYDIIVNTLLAQNKPVSANGITVALSYEVHASFTASPTDPSSLPAGGLAEGSAAISLYNAFGSTSEGGAAQLSLGVNTNTLTGEVFTVSGLLSPSNPLTIFVGIGVDGTAVGENGVAASYDANLTDTAVVPRRVVLCRRRGDNPAAGHSAWVRTRSGLHPSRRAHRSGAVGPRARHVGADGDWNGGSRVPALAPKTCSVLAIRLAQSVLPRRPVAGQGLKAGEHRRLARRGLVHALSRMIPNRGRNSGYSAAW